MTVLLDIFSPATLRALARDRSGATAVENSLLVALVSLAIVSGASEIGPLVFDLFDDTAQIIEEACDGGPGNGNGNCSNSGNGGGNTSGSGTGTGNGGSNNGQSQN